MAKIAEITLQSNKLIAVHEKGADNANLIIINRSEHRKYTLKFATADSVIVNPKLKIVALKTKRNVRVASFEKQLLKTYNMAEDVEFWKWITPNLVFYFWSTSYLAFTCCFFDLHYRQFGVCCTRIA